MNKNKKLRKTAVGASLKRRVRRYERALCLAIETLGLYAQPSSYHAIGFLADRPAGWFADDVSFVPHYNRRMPGREARRVLARLQRMLSPNQKLSERLTND